MIIRKKERLLFLRPLGPPELAQTIIRLGASFIKLAQVLATRADFFTPDYLAALKSLHDELPPMQPGDLKRVMQRAFSDDPFATLDDSPVASASIGQVHRAILKSGETVAVKLRRRGIGVQVEADLFIMRFYQKLFRPLFSHHTRNSLEALLDEFAPMIRQETDLARELANLQSFSSRYAASGVRFPVPYPKHCSEDALVMSFEEGFRFDDKEAVRHHGIDIFNVIDRLIGFYTQQMLLEGYFHADPHPGNLLLTPAGELVLLDFGMLKQISDPTRIAIIEMIKSAHERDFELFVSSCKRLGVFAYEAPQAQMVEFSRRMFEIFGNEHLSADSMQNLAYEVMTSMSDLPFKLPQEAVYISRVSAIIEGLGTTYIDNFNGIKDILPILQKNIPKALGGDNPLDLILEDLKSLPLSLRQLRKSIQKLSEDELRVHLNPAQLEWIAKEGKAYAGKLLTGLWLILTSFFVLIVFEDAQWAGIVLFVLGSLRIFYR